MLQQAHDYLPANTWQNQIPGVDPSLLHSYRKVAAHLPRCCYIFAATLLQLCHNFAQLSPTQVEQIRFSML
jgi:hypothetical protein